ncbi:glycosyltransferase family 2 protein [uncultured Trichococcus sp.]|uniref:glycosyltransferase family 2 protein n=1 Tax=uncultured Trichococcus sp. TaxID=189665 RepID=UPI0029C7830C|nr:glycosyltransferase family 2 protein [uncultured Trichococcus sp.]
MISFVVPVYNTEPYLSNCIESIIKQNIFSYEIILVNDGSTDNSLDICNEYARKYINIYVLNQENRGPSAARNAGLMEANGEYVFFIDSDDYYIKDSLIKFECTLNKNKEVDLIFGKIMMFYDNNKEERRKIKYNNTVMINSMTGEEALNYLIKTDQVMISNYSAIIRKELLIQNNILFKENIRFAEDVDFMLRVYCASKNVLFIDEFFLMYRKNREGQLTQTVNLKKLNMAIELYDKLLKEVDSWSIKENSKEYIKRYIANLYFSSLGSLNKKDLEYYQKYDLLKEYRYLIKYTGGYKFIFNKFIYNVFGFHSCLTSMQIIKKLYFHMNIYRSEILQLLKSPKP